MDKRLNYSIVIKHVVALKTFGNMCGMYDEELAVRKNQPFVNTPIKEWRQVPLFSR